MIFDSHAHYDDEDFDRDREELLSGMSSCGVGQIVNVGASIASSKRSFALAKQYDFMHCAVGIHPSETEEMTDEKLLWLKELSREEEVVAIGEIGLDYHWETPAKDLQKYWFIKQLQLAKECRMPIIIHSREAAKDTLEIMQTHADHANGGVIHCFSYEKEMARIYTDMGYYIGIGGVLTFKNGRKTKEVVADIPLSKIVIETDCPYLSPEPFRGRRNDSSNLQYVVNAIANIKGISEEEVRKTTYENACRLYRL